MSSFLNPQTEAAVNSGSDDEDEDDDDDAFMREFRAKRLKGLNLLCLIKLCSVDLYIVFEKCNLLFLSLSFCSMYVLNNTRAES